MSSIFGGSKQSSTQQSVSNNQAFPYLQGALGGGIQQGGQAGSMLGNLLGLNGGPAQTQGFQNFRDSTGYQFGKQQGMDSITGNAATQGLLNSGGTLKALDTYGQNYANTQYGNYTGLLQNQVNSGLQGAGVLAGAGQQSMSTGSSSGSSNNGGAGGFLGSLLAK